jgi:hypothetical protein
LAPAPAPAVVPTPPTTPPPAEVVAQNHVARNDI